MNPEYIKTMTIIAGSFGAEMDELTISFWAEMFKEDGISIDQIKAAAKEIIRTRKYKSMPTYAEFMEFCKGTAGDRARIQADEVIRRVRSQGSFYGNPEFDDPVTKYLMSTVWPWRSFVGQLLEKNIPFFIKDFIEAYKTYAKDLRRRDVDQIEAPAKVKHLIEGIGRLENASRQ